MRFCTLPSLIAVLGTAFLQTGCSFYSGHTAKAQLQQTAEHIVDSALMIDTRNGKVDVASDAVLTQVEIDATLVCGGDTQQEADQRIKSANFSVERDTNRTLVIKPSFPQPGHSSDGASFIVRLPGARNVTIKSSNGSVKVTGLAGDLNITTSNAGASVQDHSGPVVIDTSNGSVNVTSVKGSLNAKSSNAGVNATGVAGAVDINTSNGGIDLKLAGDQSGPLRLDTSNGGIRATVGAAFRGVVKMDTSNGRVKVTDHAGVITNQSIDGSDGTITIGQGGETTFIDTSNGSIEIIIEK